MFGIGNTVSILITAQDQASRVISQMSDKVKSDFGKLKDYVESHWREIAVILTAVSASIVAAFYKITQAAMEQEEVNNRLLISMQNLGAYTPKLYKEMLDYADSLRKVTTYSDEAIISSMADLQFTGMNTNELKAATQATLDLASAKRIDLHTASVLIGKAFVGETDTLKRYQIVIDENIPKGERFAAVLRFIAEHFNNAAQRETDIYSGKIKQLGESYGELKEALGKVVTESDAAKNSLGTLKGLIESMTTFIEEHETVVKFTLIATAITGIAASVGTLTFAVNQFLLLVGAGSLAGLLAGTGSIGGTIVAGGIIGYEIQNIIDELTGVNEERRKDEQWEAEILRIKAEDAKMQARLNLKRILQGTGKTDGSSIGDAEIVRKAIEAMRVKHDADQALAEYEKQQMADERAMIGKGKVWETHIVSIGDAKRIAEIRNATKVRDAIEAMRVKHDADQALAEYEKQQMDAERTMIDRRMGKEEFQNFDITQTKLEQFYDWFETRSQEAAENANANFNSYFFNLFTGHIRNLNDAWQGFCAAIFNAWAQTLARMAAQQTINALFGGLNTWLGWQSVGGQTTKDWAMQQSYYYSELPGMAEGGIVNAPSYYRVGESGPEAIIPLSRGRNIPVEMRGNQGGMVNNFYFVNPMDSDSIKRMIAREGETIAQVVIQDYINNGNVRSMVNGGLG